MRQSKISRSLTGQHPSLEPLVLSGTVSMLRGFNASLIPFFFYRDVAGRPVFIQLGVFCWRNMPTP
jgi:hypothetical protein